jgi:predicted RNA-binding protein
MERKYWLDVFTEKSWDEFLKAGASTSGYPDRMGKTADKIKKGDYFLCYLTKVSKFIGVLEVKSEKYYDSTKIWEDALYPIRFEVELIYELESEKSVTISELKDKLLIFKNLKNQKIWSGFFRTSPHELCLEDGKVIMQSIKERARKLTAHTDDKPPGSKSQEEFSEISHEEMQFLLLKVGSEMGLDVYVAQNDKNKQFEGTSFQKITKIKNSLPIQFDEATKKTIGLIDVLWLKGNSIIAAFEVEHTSSIYSGLLRMADLVAMQPNTKIKLYIVAPDERREKVLSEINRPTFKTLELPEFCKFIPYSKLTKEVEKFSDSIKHLKPDFIDDLAESCTTEED